MLRFVFQKMWSKKWMVISLLLGNLLMVAIAAAGPMYSEAALQRTLTQNLSNYYIETNNDPGGIILQAEFSASKKAGLQMLEQVLEEFDRMTEELDVRVLQRVNQYYISNVKVVPDFQNDDSPNDLNVRLTSYTDLEDHIQITNGTMYSDALMDNTIEVIVSEKTFVSHRLMLGQEMTLQKLVNAEGQPYRLRVTGIFENSMEQDGYWRSSPNAWGNVYVMDEGLFRELFLSTDTASVGINIEPYVLLDYTDMKGKAVAEYLDILDRYQAYFKEAGSRGFFVRARSVFENFIPESQKVHTTVLVLLVPIFVLLLAFIFMVSRQMLELEQNEIAVYKSRGANKRQIVSVYLLQSVVIALLSLAGGIPLGVFMCKMLGASNSFLEFVKRAALPIKVGETALLVAGAAALFSICTMVRPVFRYADVNIVAHKRGKNRVRKRPLWQTLFLDVLLVAVSVCTLYLYNSLRDYLAQIVLDGSALNSVFYICSSLIMIGAGLFVLRIFPWLVRLIFWVGKRWWSPGLYASFLRIIRTKSNQGFLMVFLILTVAMGIYNAQSARTINANAEERIRYINGADIVLQEVWEGNNRGTGLVADGPPADTSASISSDAAYEEPDFDKYLQIDGVECATKVLVDQAAVASVAGGKVARTVLMGIHTKEFGETAWFKESLLPLHQNAYLNAISQNSKAILVSSNFRELYGYKVGDVLSYSTGQGRALRGIIYGFVDYWPGYAPVISEKRSDGRYSETENFLIVAHLAQLQASCGVMPYQVWIRTEDSSRFMYEYAEENQIAYAMFEDTAAQIIKMKNDPVFQGTNGILTVGFICILLLCTIGFLIYWILSIQSRTLQFGIFRAMGMTMKEIFAMLIHEQIFITGISIGAGVLVGVLASKLFVPMIQIAHSSADQVLPLEIVSAASDYVRLFIVIGTAILVCMAILVGLISRIKISQALKLGED